MLLYSGWLTLIVVLSLPCYFALSILITPVLRRRLDEKFNRGADNQSFLVESVSGIDTLKSMAVEPQWTRQWDGQLAAYVRASFRAVVLSILAITIESTPPGAQELTRYQGLVGLDADSLAEAFEGYFQQSEQLPTRMLLASQAERAAGLILQKLPGAEGDTDGWDRVNALFETLGQDELASLPVDTVLWRLFHEEGVKRLDTRPLRFACSCSRERVEDMLRSLGVDEARASLEDGVAQVHCDFCGRGYRFEAEQIEALFSLAVPAPGSDRLQ